MPVAVGTVSPAREIKTALARIAAAAIAARLRLTPDVRGCCARLRFADGNELDLGRVRAPAIAKVETIKTIGRIHHSRA